MFRAQQNAFDDVIVKATDENLTSENWEYIMDVVDKVTSSDSGPKDAVAALIKRLAHRNANVQLYTLELANALSQNCGLPMHKELASRSFTDALLRLANDRNTHTQVKAKILERMSEWRDMFAKDPDLGIMDGAYQKLKHQNPSLHPPSKPQKTQITDVDRKREDEELQMALALSIKDSNKPGASSSSVPASNATTSAQPAAPTSTEPAQPMGTTAATVSRVRGLFDFTPSEPGELAFGKGDIIAVLESVYKDWWKGSLKGQIGIFPLNYVEKLQDPTREELEREAQMENEVFAELKNVERLLALLSTSDGTGAGRGGDLRENEEVTQLYHSTLAIRPKLIELIGKYSQKKDDFTQLNEKFIKARRDYENLLEASMAHPSQPTYGRPMYNYGGAPPSQGVRYGATPSYGQAPGQAPDSFYSAGPIDTHAQPSSQYPPVGANTQPFYFVPGSQQPSNGGVPPAGRLPSGGYEQQAVPGRVSSPGANMQQQQLPIRQSQRPQTMYDIRPQELATGNFDGPTSTSAQQPSSPYGSNSVLSNSTSHLPINQQQQQSSYNPHLQSHHQQQPSDPYAPSQPSGSPTYGAARPGSAGGNYAASSSSVSGIGPGGSLHEGRVYQAYPGGPGRYAGGGGGGGAAAPPVGGGAHDEAEGFYR